MSENKRLPLLILGGGYVGSRVAEKYPEARVTHRNDFDLRKRSTWSAELLRVPPGSSVLWTFPAAADPLDEALALEFFETHLKSCQVLILGTTSAYRVSVLDEWITEESELNWDQPRTRAEEKLRQKGACILHLAGIFGPARDPLTWYQKGWIQAGLSDLNLIHVEDVVRVVGLLFANPQIASQRFNLSNGQPKTHLQIIQELKDLGKLDSSFSLPAVKKQDSKRIDPSKIRAFLNLPHSGWISFPET
ncbi:MAG: hypothetical protein ACO3A2_02175 [Bdellovibrionia bacterium]